MEIKQHDKLEGVGLFATKSYEKNQIVFVLFGEILENPTRESIRIGDDQHIVDLFGSAINHSFNPTAFIDGKNKSVIALNNIAIGDEITFDYNVNEVDMACPFSINGVLVAGKKE